MDRKNWRLLDFEHNDPYMNMAIEEAVVRSVGSGITSNTIRFWRNRNAVVLGRFQDAKLEIDLDACQRLEVAVIRRFTGGGTTYHDLGNLNYAISVREGTSLLSTETSENRETLLAGVMMGLKHLGLDTTAGPSNSIELAGKKISGTATAMKWGAFFLHGTLLINTNLEILRRVLRVIPPAETINRHTVRSLRARVTTIQAHLHRQIPIKKVKNKLTKGFAQTYKVRLNMGKLTENERNLASSLYAEKYVRDEWNLHFPAEVRARS